MFDGALEKLKVNRIDNGEPGEISNENEKSGTLITSEEINFQNQTNHSTLDPRPDLPNSLLWTKLLAVAYDMDICLFGALHVMRSCGSDIKRIIIKTSDGSNGLGLMLFPYIDNIAFGQPFAKNWRSQAEYDQEKNEILGAVPGVGVKLKELFDKFNDAVVETAGNSGKVA